LQKRNATEFEYRSAKESVRFRAFFAKLQSGAWFARAVNCGARPFWEDPVMNKFIGALVAVAALASNGGSAYAAGTCAAGDKAIVTISSGGKVLVSHGGSFTSIPNGASLAPGDRILVKLGAATISIGGSSLGHVDAGSMLTIAQENGQLCVVKTAQNGASPTRPTEFVGDASDHKVGGLPWGDQGPWIAGGALIVAGGAGLAYGLSNHSENVGGFGLSNLSHQ
jgi:hypothetical protein